MSASPTTRTLDFLRKDGWLCSVVEKFNSHTMTRHDLFGFIDIIAVKGDETLAIQATSTSNLQSRVHKIASEDLADNVAAVRKAGWSIWVIGWRKYAKPENRRYWRETIVDVS